MVMLLNTKFRTVILLLSLLFIGNLALASDIDRYNQALISSTPQDTAAFSPNWVKINRGKDPQFNYLHYYYLPWADERNLAISDFKADELSVISDVTQKPGVAANSLPNSQNWVKAITQNMNMGAFPNLKMKAITVRNSNVRTIPTQDPAFSKWAVGGDGYPFDNLQTSFIAANTPVLILHTTRDGAWYFVKLAGYMGWIPSADVAFVNAGFIKKWESHAKLVPLKDMMVPTRKLSDPSLQLRIGILYPKVSESKNAYQIYTAVSDTNHEAQLKVVSVSKKYMRAFPLPISVENISKLANTLLKNPYGWGGMYGYRDCSATTSDLMAQVGIWLPRNSGDQAKQGHVISLAGMSPDEKERTIIKYGVPLVTLIHLPGHIMLYVGEKNATAYIYHNSWVLYRTMVSPMRIVSWRGKNLLKAVDSMTILAQP